MNTISLLLALFFVPKEAPKVYVCKSGTSYAYHKKLCQGLKRCSHRIDTLTVKEAVESGHEKPCGYCYK